MPSVQNEVFSFFPADWIVNANVANNTTCVATKTGVAGKQHYLLHFSASLDAAAGAATTVLVKDGSTVIWEERVSTSTQSIDRSFERRPLPISNGATLTITLGALGGTVGGSVNMSGFTQLAP